MVVTYILWCIRIGTKPCKYFQLNARYFNQKKGIFSKIEIDELIPKRWRLSQFYDDNERKPECYPVFIKPEWGQNAKGIVRAKGAQELQQAREALVDSGIRHLIQQQAPENQEFEIFSIRHHLHQDQYAIFTITEAVNDAEKNPINSIYNHHTRYVEVTDCFCESDKSRIWGYLGEIGQFNIARMSVRANGKQDLVDGRFHVIEINLFLPMPINFLDNKYQWQDIRRLVKQYMLALAQITWARDKTQPTKPVFTKVMLYDRKSRLLNYFREKL